MFLTENDKFSAACKLTCLITINVVEARGKSWKAMVPSLGAKLFPFKLRRDHLGASQFLKVWPYVVQTISSTVNWSIGSLIFFFNMDSIEPVETGHSSSFLEFIMVKSLSLSYFVLWLLIWTILCGFFCCCWLRVLLIPLSNVFSWFVTPDLYLDLNIASEEPSKGTTGAKLDPGALGFKWIIAVIQKRQDTAEPTYYAPDIVQNVLSWASHYPSDPILDIVPE